MAVFTKKKEKIEKLICKYGSMGLEEFKEKFKTEYPKEWGRIKSTYFKEEKKTKPGKKHPMPNPEKYLENMYKTYANKK